MTYYSGNPVYTEIRDRFLNFRPQILLGEHIDTMKKIGRTTSEGITFVPKSPYMFRYAVAFAYTGESNGIRAFHWDNRNNFINRIAALATDGEGYREIGSPSLHCDIGKQVCKVHIDEFGFVSRGQNGNTYFTPESIRHAFDELGWRAIIRPQLVKGLELALPKYLSEPAAQLLDRTYLVTPSAENLYNFREIGLGEGTSLQMRDFKPRIGGGVKLLDKNFLKLKFEYTCGNSDCTDNQAMVQLSLDLDELAKKFSR